MSPIRLWQYLMFGSVWMCMKKHGRFVMSESWLVRIALELWMFNLWAKQQTHIWGNLCNKSVNVSRFGRFGARIPLTNHYQNWGFSQRAGRLVAINWPWKLPRKPVPKQVIKIIGFVFNGEKLNTTCVDLYHNVWCVNIYIYIYWPYAIWCIYKYNMYNTMYDVYTNDVSMTLLLTCKLQAWTPTLPQRQYGHSIYIYIASTYIGFSQCQTYMILETMTFQNWNI